MTLQGNRTFLYIECLVSQFTSICLQALTKHHPEDKHYNKVIATSKTTLIPKERPSKLSRKHQRDADRRDAIITLDSERPRILKRNKGLPDDLGEPPASLSLPASVLRKKALVSIIDIA